ncbi:MAG TPA: ACP S-malonyltransferase [Prochlorococcaceae cyanobacterium AMR_MDS_5431]|nr:ACP S-malonyltransferase [Prochlorococcaceae cyanobacterium AMR_MDS_5431]
MSIAWIFPGQGSQKLGMAENILTFSESKVRFEEASNLLGKDLLEICSKDNLGVNSIDKPLNNTENTQLALFVLETLLIDTLRLQGSQPHMVAGHSLGEFSALYAAGVFNITTGLTLVKYRSQLMASANGGGMIAIIGFDETQLKELLAKRQGIVIANDNSPSQIVLSGEKCAIQDISKVITCKRAIPLMVSGAFHSPFMHEAATTFSRILDRTIFHDAQIPVLSNVDPRPSCDGSLLKQRLQRQMTTGVRWRETMQALDYHGVHLTIELGPGSVLGNLCKRNLRSVTNVQIAESSDLGL